MKKRKFHITIYFLLIWNFSFAQQYTNITTKDGLPSNHIYKIIQDKKGFIWIATDKGLVKYNGNTIKTFTTKDGLATNSVWGIHSTPDNKLWYLSKASKLGYIENDSIYSFESEEKGEIFNPTHTSQINNDIVLGSSIRFHVLKDKKWKAKGDTYSGKSEIKIYVKHQTISGLTSGLNKGLRIVEVKDKANKTIKTFDLSSVLDRIHFRGQITDSLFYWVDNKKYTFLNLNTLKLYQKKYKDEIGIEQTKHARINLINNQLQITGSGFVGVLDNNLNIINTFYIPKHLKAHFACIDKSGSIWISTFTNGIYHLPKEKQHIKYSLQSEKIIDVNYVNDKIIASVFNKGFYLYNNSKNTFLPYINESSYVYGATYIKQLGTEYYTSKLNIKAIKNNNKTQIKFSGNDIPFNETARQLVFYNKYLYGTNTFAINKINPTNLNIEKQYLQAGTNQLFTFKDEFLAATSIGLKHFIDEEFEIIKFTNQDFNKPTLNITKVNDSEILLNTDGFGAYISDLKTISQLPNSEFLIVNSSYVKDNSIWLATESGILEYSKSDGFYSLKKTINKNDGLPSNNVSNILVKGNKLIVSTNNGIAILPTNQKKNNQFRSIYFDKVTYNNQTIKNKQVKYISDNQLQVKIASIDFSEGEKLNYSYQLLPIQKKWTTTNSNQILFNNLQPNEYTLNIKPVLESNYDDVNTGNRSLKFEIKPLWYQTLIFKIALGVASLSLLFLTFSILKRTELKKQEKKFTQEKLLSEIQLKALRSQMNPHFVFNSLAAIQYYINNNEIEESEGYLVKFSKLIRQFFELSKETEISLAQEIKLIENYLDIEKLRFKDKFEYTINVDSKLNKNEVKLPTMLLQPIVENAVNHGIFNKLANGNIIINFNQHQKNSLFVEIIDDGVGFVNTKKDRLGKIKSSNVLEERLRFLNQTGKWKITYNTEELHPTQEDKGNKSTFIITQIK